MYLVSKSFAVKDVFKLLILRSQPPKRQDYRSATPYLALHFPTTHTLKESTLSYYSKNIMSGFLQTQPVITES